ncbi:GNAT family N-acetyltransferase [Cellulomonas endometrii]|uniref:GNAT family N-acetyltransferase n=1 Tax=Cellulomonas endometrii TaxID=3036301 RepID=UPI0024ADEE48|nr:GNAT family N-acetyltransferase [Cellulomonas endometrii]
MTGVRVRVARPDEYDQAGALTAEAYRADGLLALDEEYETELRDAAQRAREAVLLVATVPADPDAPGSGSAPAAPEVVVGTITLAPYGTSYAEIAEPGELELRMLAVAPEARRRGVAERLMTAALREAVARRARRVVLSTLDEMAAARRLYDRLGLVAAPARDWAHESIAVRVLTWEPPAAPGALVEAATWVPAATEVVDGWRLGLSGGFTRRANSVLPLGAPADVRATLARVEERYAAAGQPSVVRVCSAAPPGLADVLAERGYASVAATDVLVRDLAAAPPAEVHTGPDVRVRVGDRPDDAWLAGWLDVKAAGRAVDHGVARRVLTGSAALYLTATAPDGAVLGVLRAALAEDWTGLSCLVVAPAARRRGLGRLLTRAALRATADRGARRAFLQVEVANHGAADLYAGEGFGPSERYAYWQR